MTIETIDDQEIDKGIAIYSKLSITLTSILFTPMIGALLFCYNYYKLAKKKDNISKMYFSIILVYAVSLLPLIGFKSNFLGFNYIPFISILITIGIMVGPFWEKHFSEINYESKFPKILTFWLLAYLVLTVFHNVEIQSNIGPQDRPQTYSFPIHFNGFMSFSVVQFYMLYRFIHILVFDQKKTKKANLKNDIPAEN
ncbi:MAG: hypothetical protein ACI9N1_002800 [Flavobacteriales bacterium]|jgi:hypothetical protein